MKGWMLDSIMEDTVCVSQSQSVVNLTQQGNQTLASVWLWSSRARCCKRDIKLETKTNYCADQRVYRAEIKSCKYVFTLNNVCACVYRLKCSVRLLKGHTLTLRPAGSPDKTDYCMYINLFLSVFLCMRCDIRSPLSLSSHLIHLSASVWFFLLQHDLLSPWMELRDWTETRKSSGRSLA